MVSTPVRTRMAPSPTGELHIGGLRTLLYSYALARQSGGQFIIRIEDTDQKRFIKGAQERLLQVVKDYGLSWDEGPDVGGPYGPYIQTARQNIYQQHIKTLLDNHHAYYCFCTEERLSELRETQKAAKKVPKYDRHCLHLTKEEVEKNLQDNIPFVIRLKVPEDETLSFTDVVRGPIKFSGRDVDDQVLIKSNGIPTYHFAVVVDDHLMKITHIFRGEEWITSTPKHVLLYRYFGWDMPSIAHLTVFLDPQGKGKMSKRHGSTHAQAFLDDGYLPEAVLNFIMLLGWNPGTNQELFTLDEFVTQFSLKHLHKKAPAFDRKKLDYINGLYIRKKAVNELLPYFKRFLPNASDGQLTILIPILKDRITKFSDLNNLTAFLFQDISYDKELLLKKGTSSEVAAEMLTKTKAIFSSESIFEFVNLNSKLLALISENSWNIGEYFMVLRIAICGVAFTPPVVECLPALGKESTLRKLNIALSLLK